MLRYKEHKLGSSLVKPWVMIYMGRTACGSNIIYRLLYVFNTFRETNALSEPMTTWSALNS